MLGVDPADSPSRRRADRERPGARPGDRRECRPCRLEFLAVFLAHPVPASGEYRLAIIKTYKDDKSYYTEGEQIVFKRPLGIPRDGIVLPAGYEIVSCSVAAQVLTEADGLLNLAFVNAGSGGQLEVTIKARKLTVTRSTRSVPPAVAGGFAIPEVGR